MTNISELLAWVITFLAYLSLIGVCALRSLWRHRLFLVQGVYTLLAMSLLFAFMGDPLFITRQHTGILLGLVLVTILFLAVRIHIGRLPSEFLRHNTLTAGAVSGGLFALLLFSIITLAPASPTFLLIVIATASLLTALGLSLQASWALRHYIFDVKLENKPAPHQLPTVTLAIPARNETAVLAACLDAALQSDYQKLEILVLDDCSHDNTSVLIKSYAHSGVRFIKGEAPSSGWLGKTNAYSQLASEASGAILFFIGVDTLLHAETISRTVRYLDGHKLDMVSILPRLSVPFGAAALLQNLRYVWQIIMPIAKRRVPVSSEAWAIRRTALTALGGFSGVKHKIIPEGSFARRLMATNRYHFVIASHILPMEFTKGWRSQRRTAVRLLYPTLKRQPLRAFMAVTLLALGGCSPFLIIIFAPMLSLLWVLSAVTSLLYILLYAGILWRMQARWWWLAMWFLPFVLVQEIALILISLALYEFSTVDWKGRNVCYPVLLHKRR
ncbi:MAG TPA: glycosyltransferase family 2 protein [Candidatus Saccharimonadales bacterium]